MFTGQTAQTSPNPSVTTTSSTIPPHLVASSASSTTAVTTVTPIISQSPSAVAQVVQSSQPQASTSSSAIPPTHQSQQMGSAFQQVASTATATIYQSPSAIIGGIEKLLNATATDHEKKELRVAVSRPTDALLETIISQETAVMQTQGGDLTQLNPSYTKVDYPISTTRGQPESFAVWKADPGQKRMVMDNGPFKMENIILPQLTRSPLSLEWQDWTTNVKTCTSILTNQEASFCGNNGMLVYLAPTDPSAMVNAAPHDVLSPSEKPPPPPNSPQQAYQTARTTVEAYVKDQENLKVAHDFVEDLINKCKDKLITLPSQPNPITKGLLTSFDTPTFDKTYYTSTVPVTKIQQQILVLKNILKAHPDMESELGILISDLNTLAKSVSDFLKDQTILKRGTQRQDTTGWEMTESAPTHHPLHPVQRSRDQEIRTLYMELKREGILKEPLSGPGEAMTLQQMKDFLNQYKDQLFANIFLNVLENYTASKAIELLELKKSNSQYTKILAELSSANPTNSVIQSKISSLIQLIEQEKTQSQNLYPEIQMHSNKLKVSGLGVKKSIIDKLTLPNFAAAYQAYESIRNSSNILPQDKDTEYQKLVGAGSLFQSVEELKTAVLTYKIMEQAKLKNIPLFLHEKS